MDGWMDIYSTVLALARRNIRQWRMHLNSGSSGAPKAPMSVIYCVLVWWWCIYSKELCGWVWCILSRDVFVQNIPSVEIGDIWGIR